MPPYAHLIQQRQAQSLRGLVISGRDEIASVPDLYSTLPICWVSSFSALDSLSISIVVLGTYSWRSPTFLLWCRMYLQLPLTQQKQIRWFRRVDAVDTVVTIDEKDPQYRNAFVYYQMLCRTVCPQPFTQSYKCFLQPLIDGDLSLSQDTRENQKIQENQQTQEQRQATLLTQRFVLRLLGHWKKLDVSAIHGRRVYQRWMPNDGRDNRSDNNSIHLFRLHCQLLAHDFSRMIHIPEMSAPNRMQHLELLNIALANGQRSHGNKNHNVDLVHKPIPWHLVGLNRRWIQNWASLQRRLEPYAHLVTPQMPQAVNGLVLQRCEEEKIALEWTKGPLWNASIKERLNYGQIGCFLSHVQDWRRIEAHPQQSTQPSLHGEDDFWLHPLFGNVMRALLPLFWHDHKDDKSTTTQTNNGGWDVIWIGYHWHKDNQRWAMAGQSEIVQLVPLMHNPNANIGGTFGYILTAQGRRRLIEAFDKSQPTIRLGIDVWMMQQSPFQQLTLNVPMVLSEYFNNDPNHASDCSY